MRFLYLYGEELTGKRAREIHTLNRILSLALSGMEVTFVFALSRRDEAEAVIKGIAPDVLTKVRLKTFSREWKISPIAIKSSDYFYQQVGKWMEGEAPFDCAYGIHLKGASFLKKRFPKLPMVFEAHEIFSDAFDCRNWRYRKLCLHEQSVYKQINAVVSTSEYLLGELEKSFTIPKKRLVSPNCAEPIFFDFSLDRMISNKIVYLGSFQPWKGLSNALMAMKLLPEFELTIIGGSEREIGEIELEAPKNVRFLGFRTHGQIQEEMEKASIALIPNRLIPVNSLQTFPMKLVEYAASGKKIVSTDLPILKELVPGAWCSRVPADRPEEIAAAVRYQSTRVEDPRLIREWARAFQWGHQADRIKGFIESL